MKRLSDELAQLFQKEIQAIFLAEIAEKDFMPQSDYENCFARAEDIVDTASVSVKRALALAIAKHREEKHNEDRSAEREELIALMTSEEQSVGLMSWWNG